MCFSTYWLVVTFLQIVGLIVFVMIVNILLPWLLGLVGLAVTEPLWRVLKLILGFIILCFVVWLIYDTFTCFFYGGGAYPYRARP